MEKIVGALICGYVILRISYARDIPLWVRAPGVVAIAFIANRLLFG